MRRDGIGSKLQPCLLSLEAWLIQSLLTFAEWAMEFQSTATYVVTITVYFVADRSTKFDTSKTPMACLETSESLLLN